MGIFFRKSLRFGPLRFNLSKSGLGISAGIKGARIGLGMRGPYVAGGRNGIYFRENLGNNSDHQATPATKSGSLAVGVAILLVAGFLLLVALWFFG